MTLRVSYIVLEASRGFRRNLLLATSMVIITAISLTQLGLALLAGRQLDLYGQFWSNRVEVSVFLADTVTNEQRAAIHRQLVTNPAVASVHHQSKAEAFQEFSRLFRDTPEIVRVASPADLPESFRVKLVDPARFGEVHDGFCTGLLDDRGNERCVAGISEIIDQRQVVRRAFSVLELTRNLLGGMAAALGAAAVILIAVTVRVAVYARRRELQIMKLVGASNLYVRLPFLAEGLVAGLLGAGLACLLLRLVLAYLGQARTQAALFVGLPLVDANDFLAVALTLLAVGAAASLLTTALALRRYVRV